MTKRAKTLPAGGLDRLLAYIDSHSSRPQRDRVIIELSFHAGLRVGEIAKLSWHDVTDAVGAITSESIEIPRHAAKKGHARSIPIHPGLRTALEALRNYESSELTIGQTPIVRRCDDTGAMSPNSLQRHVGRLLQRAGFAGCSSHTGRRTFITQLARSASTHGCSIRDVQQMAGHRYLDTTGAYIEPSDGITALIRSL